MRFEVDKSGLYRFNAQQMKPGPNATFFCCRCAKPKQILGRKKVGQNGRPALYACVGCQEVK
jgi:hypothetical protein